MYNEPKNTIVLFKAKMDREQYEERQQQLQFYFKNVFQEILLLGPGFNLFERSEEMRKKLSKEYKIMDDLITIRRAFLKAPED